MLPCSFETVEKVFSTVSRRGQSPIPGENGPLQRTHCPSETACSHVCGPRSVFVHVHAAAENGFVSLRAGRRKLCEAFSST